MNKEEDKLILLIEDNGIGIHLSQQSKKEKSQKHKSLATQITKERLERIKRQSRQNVIFEIKDLLENQYSYGTQVRLVFPLQY